MCGSCGAPILRQPRAPVAGGPSRPRKNQPRAAALSMRAPAARQPRGVVPIVFSSPTQFPHTLVCSLQPHLRTRRRGAWPKRGRCARTASQPRARRAPRGAAEQRGAARQPCARRPWHDATAMRRTLILAESVLSPQLATRVGALTKASHGVSPFSPATIRGVDNTVGWTRARTALSALPRWVVFLMASRILALWRACRIRTRRCAT